MKYIFSGNIRAFYCGDCFDFLSRVTVKLYPSGRQELTAAREKETFHLRGKEEMQAIGKLLMAESVTDEQGNFSIALSDKEYQGGAFDIDFECATVPLAVKLKNPPKPKEAFQFHITTYQPVWQGSDSATTHEVQKAHAPFEISSRFWCRLLQLFRVYVVCGIVTDCKTGIPVPGVKVKAYDVDLLQDDFLGEGFTDASGRFKIYYTEADFSKTIFSWLNVEWPAGPDLYFSIESSSGFELLKEDRQLGHRRDRENASNCFCVKLCVSDLPETPWFTHVGNFNISTDLTASGTTILQRTLAGGVGYGFFNNIKLKGYATKKIPSAPSLPLYYRFLYSDDNGVNYQPITASKLVQSEFTVASRLIPWGTGSMFQDVVIDITQPESVADSIPAYDGSPAPPRHVLHPDADGWVRVDQVCMDNGFLGTLLYIKSDTLEPGGAATTPGDQPGDPASSPKNGKLVLLKFQTTDDKANPASVYFNEQTIQAAIYINNWNELSLITIDELFSGGLSGCNPIATNAHVKYTVDHEFSGGWSITAWSAAIPGGISGLPSGSSGRGVANTIDLATHAGLSPAFPGGWPSCAYAISLNTIRKLTDGESNDTGRPNQIIFCR